METTEREVKFAAIDNRIANAAEFISRISNAAGPYTFRVLRAESKLQLPAE